MQRLAWVGLSRACHGLRRTRAHGGGGGRRSDEAAFGADVLLPPRQRALPGRAAGDPEARARSGGEEKARPGDDRRMGGAALALRLSARSGLAEAGAPLFTRPQQGRGQGARAGLQADWADSRAALRTLRPVARCARIPLAAVRTRVLPARNWLPGPST